MTSCRRIAALALACAAFAGCGRTVNDNLAAHQEKQDLENLQQVIDDGMKQTQQP